jgi:hypothetical protein
LQIFALTRVNAFQRIVHAFSLKRSSFLRELVTAPKAEKFLKNDVGLFFLENTEKAGLLQVCYRILHQNGGKSPVSHLAR